MKTICDYQIQCVQFNFFINYLLSKVGNHTDKILDKYIKRNVQNDPNFTEIIYNVHVLTET